MSDNTQTPESVLPRRRQNGSAAAPVVLPTTTLAAAPEAVEEAEQAAQEPAVAEEVAAAVAADTSDDNTILVPAEMPPMSTADVDARKAANRDRMAKVRAARAAKPKGTIVARARAARKMINTAKAKSKKSNRKGPPAAFDAAGIKELAALAKAGKSLRQAAKKLKVSVMTASRYAKQNGITFIDGRKLRFAKKGAKTKVAAKAAPVKRSRAAKGKDTTSRTNADVTALARAIARELGKALRSI